MKLHWPIFVVVLLVLVAIRQTSRIHAIGIDQSELEGRLETLNTELAEIDRPLLPELVLSDADKEELRQRAERVHQLRGDVTMAHKEHERIKVAVEKLSKLYGARSNQLAFAQAPVFPNGYKPNGYKPGSALHNVGQTSPEATVETFFHANIAGDIDLAIPCLNELAEQKNLDDAAKQRTTDQMKQMFSRFPGYQLIAREQLTPAKARLGIRTSPESKTIHIVLDLTDRIWVINANESELFK